MLLNIGKEYIENILILCGINMMVVMGLSLLTGFTGLFSFGHAGFMAIGAYTSGYFSTVLHTPFIVSVLAGGIMAMFISFFILFSEEAGALSGAPAAPLVNPDPPVRGGSLFY